MSDIELNIMNGKRLDDVGEIQHVFDLMAADAQAAVSFIKDPKTGQWYICASNDIDGTGDDPEEGVAGIYTLAPDCLMPSILESMLRDSATPVGIKRDEVVAVIGGDGMVKGANSDIAGLMQFERWATEADSDHDPYEKKAEAARREFYAEREGDDG